MLEEEVRVRLSGEFGDRWPCFLLGCHQPFTYQLFNNAFLRVRDVVFGEYGTVLSLLSKPVDVCNIIIG